MFSRLPASFTPGPWLLSNICAAAAGVDVLVESALLTPKATFRAIRPPV